MHSSIAPPARGTLGRYLRAVRRQRKLAAQTLGAPEFTAHYIRAVETGRIVPSLPALQRLAVRLGLDPGALCSLRPHLPGTPDMAALDEDIAYQLDLVKTAIHSQQPHTALADLRTLTQEYAPYLDACTPHTRYRFYRLYAATYVRLNDPVAAEQAIACALSLAQQLDDPQEIERTRNVLGAIYYLRDRPDQALEQHARCLQAIHTGVVKDLQLRLHIYSNLGNDHWALGHFARAINLYQEALTLLTDVNDSERRAAIDWGLSLCHKGQGDLGRAKLYAAQALTHYEAAGNGTATAEMQCNLAAILVARQEYAAARSLIEAALAVVGPTDNLVLLSNLYEHYATLEQMCGNLAAARLQAEQSVWHAAAAFRQREAPALTAQAHIIRSYARALRIRGAIDEQLGRPVQADAAFAQAIALLTPTRPAETLCEILASHAEILMARGDHQQAGAQYRAAICIQAGWPRSVA